MAHGEKRIHYPKKHLGRRTFQVSRLVMEEQLDRRLSRFEVVHHIDGDIQNNSPENLQVMTLAEHGRFHHSGRPLPEETRQKISHSMKAYHAANPKPEASHGGCCMVCGRILLSRDRWAGVCGLCPKKGGAS
jgi:hypothetical protein